MKVISREGGSLATSPSNGTIKCRQVGLDEIGRTLSPLAHKEEEFLSTLATFHQHLQAASEGNIQPYEFAEDCDYLLCDLQLLAKFKPEYYQVEFQRNSQIGKVFIDAGGLLAFYDSTPEAREYYPLLFQHQSVLDLFKDYDDLRRFARRLPILTAELIDAYPELLDKVQGFRNLRRLVRYMPHKRLEIIKKRLDLVKEPDDLWQTLQFNPELAPFLLSDQILKEKGFAVPEKARQKFLQDANKKIAKIQNTEKFLKKLGERVEENDVFAMLDLARIHFYGEQAPFVTCRDKTNDFKYAGAYLTLAQRMLDRLDKLDDSHPDKEAFERDQKVKPDAHKTLQNLRTSFQQENTDYLRRHPEEITLFDADSIIQLSDAEQVESEFLEQLLTTYEGEATEATIKEYVIAELVRLPFDRVLRYSQNSAKIAAICSDPDMTFFWNQHLTSSEQKIDPRDVLDGQSFKTVMSMWYLSHYEHWHLAGRHFEPAAEALLDKAIEFESGIAMFTKATHIFDYSAKHGALKQDQIRQLLNIKDTAKEKFFTFGSVISGVVAFNFALFCAQKKNFVAAYKFINEARESLHSANFLEGHDQSLLELENFGVTVKELIEVSGKGRTFVSYEQTEADIMSIILVKPRVVGGRCADEARRFGGIGFDPTYDRNDTLLAGLFNANIAKQASAFYDQKVAQFNDQVDKANDIRAEIKPLPKPKYEIYSQGIPTDKLKEFHEQLVRELDSEVTTWKALRNCTEAIHAYREEQFSRSTGKSSSRKIKGTGVVRMGIHKPRRLNFDDIAADNQDDVVASKQQQTQAGNKKGKAQQSRDDETSIISRKNEKVGASKNKINKDKCAVSVEYVETTGPLSMDFF